MKVAENTVITMHYAVHSADTTLDSTYDKQPMSFLIGHQQLIEGLEEALLGHEAGETLQVTVPPEKAYGARLDTLVQVVPMDMFAGMNVQPGMQFRATTDDGEQSVIVLDVDEEGVTVDGNHPLSGHTLTFDVELLEVRAATADEIAHGHAHNADGHHEDH